MCKILKYALSGISQRRISGLTAIINFQELAMLNVRRFVWRFVWSPVKTLFSHMEFLRVYSNRFYSGAKFKQPKIV